MSRVVLRNLKDYAAAIYNVGSERELVQTIGMLGSVWLSDCNVDDEDPNRTVLSRARPIGRRDL